jgi:TolB-like protein/Flp pilus assembly protein TadD
MSKPAGTIYGFGLFSLDAEERVLLRDGKPVALTPKAFATLLLLVEKSGHIVDKDDFAKALWPDTFVEEGNLAQNIFKLRKILGQGSNGNSYIETIPKRGYRFTAPVRVEGHTESSVSVKLSAESQKRAETLDQLDADRNIRSLAVLPLINTSTNENAEYLSDGITESIINSLSHLPQLHVMAPSTVFRYKGQEVSPQQVGRELSVETVLTGRVLQVSGRLVIRVELVDTATGRQLWGDQYDRRPADILEVQEEVSREISEKLRLKLTDTQKRRLVKRHTQNIEAYKLYLKGRFFWSKHKKGCVERSISYFKKAIALDPNYALAFTGLADSYQRLSNIKLPPKKALPKAKIAAAQAIALDDTLAEAYAAWGWVKMFYDHDWAGAERALRRAVELNPGASISHQRYGSYLTFTGRFEESLSEIIMAQELDPLSIQNTVNLASTLCLMKRFDEAIGILHQTLELEPNYRAAHYTLGCAYRAQGNFKGALREFEKLLRMEGDSDLALSSIGNILALCGDKSAAEKVLSQLLDMAKLKYVSPYSIAIIYIGFDNKDAAFNWMEKLYSDCNDWLVWLKVGPEFDPLRLDERFNNLLRRVGLIDEPQKQLS